MIRIWKWLKDHWRWVVFPIGVLGAVLGWFFWWRGKQVGDDAESGTSDEAADRAVDSIVSAGEKRDRELKELEKRHAEKLDTMTEEQTAEYNDVRKKPVEEVASWIDEL